MAKYLQTIRKFFLLAWLSSASVGSEVLELEESEVRGKKDQPEAMTFLSRAPLPISDEVVELRTIDNIKAEIDSDIFSVRTMHSIHMHQRQ